MRILNIDDSAIKSSKINRLLKPIAGRKIEWRSNLADGIDAIREALADDPYDLVITDMFYPEYPGGYEVKSGILLVEKIQEEKWDLPVIVFSSEARYEIDGIYGAVRFSEIGCWEDEMKELVLGQKLRLKKVPFRNYGSEKKEKPVNE